MKIKSSLIFFLFICLFLSNQLFAQIGMKKTTEEEDRLSEFKETQFLQVDEIDVPRELKIIEEQIRQNSLDVIISSKTHTPVYAQKLPDGYTENYKNFHSLIVRIVPIDGVTDYYSLVFQYHNWTTNKKDKKLRKKISKYNVLNEMRFALYELLLGKQFVIKNKDKIEKQNYDRIQAIRNQEEQEKRRQRLEKKENEKKQAKLEELLEREEEKVALLKREKKTKSTDIKENENSESTSEEGSIVNSTQAASIREDVAELSIDLPLKENDISRGKPVISEQKKPVMKVEDKSMEEGKVSELENAPFTREATESSNSRTNNFYALMNYFNSEIVADGLLHSTTSLNYLGFGARYSSEQQKDLPIGYQLSLKVGMPVKKDDYSFPVYRALESEFYKKGILGHFTVFGGVDFSPIYFVNLATPGEGIKVFENDFFWMKAGIAFNNYFLGKEIFLRFSIQKSLMAKSNQNKALSGSSLSGSLGYWHNQKNGAEISFTQNSLSGDVAVSGKGLLISYVYKFEN